jgi:hypothetical protein
MKTSPTAEAIFFLYFDPSIALMGPAEGVLIGILILNIGCCVKAAGSLTQQGLHDQIIKIITLQESVITD